MALVRASPNFRASQWYRYGGGAIESALPLIELSEVEPRLFVAATISIDLYPIPSGQSGLPCIHNWTSDSSATETVLSLHRTDDGLLLRFPGLADFEIKEGWQQIRVRPVPGVGEETLRHLLLDQVLPRVLAQAGRIVLHAGGVQIGSAAMAFVGDTGSGKSTLTASFHSSGYPLLSDDGLVLSQEGNVTLATPTYPSLRLWPDSVTRLYEQTPTLAPMAHYSAKQRVMVSDEADSNVACKLAAIFVLTNKRDTRSAEITLTQLSPADACMAIIRNTFQLDVTDRGRAALLFSAASSMARQLPVFSVGFPWDYSRLPEARDAILHVCDRLKSGGASDICSQPMP